jgi:peptidoglycan/LPS O-acetylase OafA/YrhL
VRLLIASEDAEAHRSNNFDAIRLAMALLVVWSHSFALYLGSEDTEWISVLLGGAYNAGNLAVMAFFIISGFLITRSYTRSRSLMSYMEKRIRRIYPGYLVATTICAFIVVPLYSSIAKLDTAELMKTLGLNLLLQGYFPPSNAFTANAFPNAVNGSLWSIPFEFWCYIGVALLGVTSLITKRWFLVGLLASVLISRVALDLLGRKPGLGIIGVVFGWPYLWVCILPSFLLGMVAFAFREALPRSPLILFGIVILAVAACHLNEHMAHLLVAPALAYALFFVAFSERVLLPNATRFGDFSYGTYLYAFPIQQMLYAEIGYQVTLPTYIAASLVLSLLAGIASWYLIERWFLSPSRSRAKQTERDVVAEPKVGAL